MKHITLRLFFALLGLACAGHAAAATYYINSNGGNDFYTGTSASATSATVGPWQTLAKLANVTLAPGDTVYLACGSVWKETLQPRSSGTAAAPITITAGPGTCTTAPLIDGATTIPAHAWVQHSGSIYRARLPVDLVANPNPGASMSGWASWSASGDSTLVPDNACPGQAAPCMAFTSGTSASIAISNTFPLAGGVDYTAGVQLHAPAGTRIKVVVRRGGPTYESLAPEQWITAAGAWQSVGLTFRPAATVANARIDIEVPATRIRVNVREAHLRHSAAGGNVLATFVDSLQVRRAHHPNFGQGGDPTSPYAATGSAGGRTVVDTTGLALPAGGTLNSVLGVTMRTINWAVEERAVTGVNGSRLTLNSPTEYDIQPGYGYYLTGALWMLDSAGEWFYDTSTSTLYAWMPDGAAPGNRVSVGGPAVGVDLNAKANVTLRGISVRHVGVGALLTGSSAIRLNGVAISDTVDYGISANNCAQCAMQSGSVARTGLDAVSIAGVQATGFQLTDSIIADSGATARTDGWRMLPRPARAAVYVIGAQPSILRNSITNTANLGVYLGPNGTFANNYVNRACLTLNDCGAIYSNYIGTNVTITGNLVENVTGNLAGLPGTPRTHTVGIYLDERNADSLVSGNTVTGADYGIQLFSNHGTIVRDNVLYGNRRYQLWLQEGTSVIRANGDSFNNRIESNLFVPTARGPSVYLESVIGDTSDFATFSGNRYSGLFSPQVVGEQSPSRNAIYTVADWQTAGRETAPLVADPAGYASYLAIGTSVLINGALANGATGWTSWNQTAPFATVSLRACGFAPCLDLRAGSTISLFSTPNFSIAGGQWYRVSFDAATALDGQRVNVLVRRGGGGSNGYESLMPSGGESFTGSTSWRRYSFMFQATGTVIAGNPVTRDHGARIDFEKNQPGAALSIARVEMVAMTPVQVALEVKLLLNRQNATANLACSSLGVPDSMCNYFVYLHDGSQVFWAAPVAPLSGRPVSTRDTSLVDSDGDGIADQQDACLNTPAGAVVNARGCGFNQ